MNRNKTEKVVAAQVFLASLGTFLLCALFAAVLVDTKTLNINALSLETDTISGRQALRLAALIINLLTFAGAAVLALLFVFRRHWAGQAGLNRGPVAGSAVWAATFFIISLPFVTWLAYWNLQLPLPEWMAKSEKSADALLEGILRMETVPELIMALLAAALTPALGEELLLRGVVQRQILRPVLGNPHAAIWVAAALFSAMHLEFGGFFPRLILGALLGYAYYWSRSLWVPIVLHFLFNGVQVMVAYVSGEFNPQGDATDVPPLWAGIISLVLMVAVGVYAERKFGGDRKGSPHL
jgi:hypothetical protein